MKKAYKILSICLMVLMLAPICTSVFATISIDNVMQQSKDINSDAQNAMSKFGGTIIGYVTNAAMVISVVMIAILGVKYMMGSAEDKSEYKKSLIPLLVGAVCVFGAATIAKIIVGLAGSFNTTTDAGQQSQS